MWGGLPTLLPGIHSWLLRHWSDTRVAEFPPDGEPIMKSPSAFCYLRYLLWGTRPAWQKPIWTIWKLPPPGIIVDSSGSSKVTTKECQCVRLGLLTLFRVSSGWTGSLYKWPAWQLRSYEEHAGGIICDICERQKHL